MCHFPGTTYSSAPLVSFSVRGKVIAEVGKWSVLCRRYRFRRKCGWTTRTMWWAGVYTMDQVGAWYIGDVTTNAAAWDELSPTRRTIEYIVEGSSRSCSDNVIIIQLRIVTLAVNSLVLIEIYNNVNSTQFKNHLFKNILFISPKTKFLQNQQQTTSQSFLAAIKFTRKTSFTNKKKLSCAFQFKKLLNIYRVLQSDAKKSKDKFYI